MRRLFAAALLAATAMASAACDAKAERDPGPMAAKQFSVGDFKRIESAGAFDVSVRTGAAPSVRAEGPQNVLDRLDITVEGDELHIRPRNGGFSWRRSAPVKIAVTVPRLEEATIAGSGTLTVDKVAVDTFKAGIAGSGDLSIPQIKAKAVEFEIAGSGSAEIGGQTETAKYTIAGSGELDASRLKSRDVSLTIAGSGAVQANASGKVDGEILGSGEARVTGGAKCTVEKLGSGSIVCA
jgi:hypothetical protein